MTGFENLQALEDNQTLLVQSGKPVAVMRTHEDAPRVLMPTQTSSPSGQHGTHFHELDKRAHDVWPDDCRQLDLHRHPGILGTYETFCAAGEPIMEMRTSVAVPS